MNTQTDGWIYRNCILISLKKKIKIQYIGSFPRFSVLAESYNCNVQNYFVLQRSARNQCPQKLELEPFQAIRHIHVTMVRTEWPFTQWHGRISHLLRYSVQARHWKVMSTFAHDNFQSFKIGQDAVLTT